MVRNAEFSSELSFYCLEIWDLLLLIPYLVKALIRSSFKINMKGKFY